MNTFLQAMQFAEKAHKGQLRKDKTTPYFLHPISVAMHLNAFPEAVQCAALLHDVVEDTPVTQEEIEDLFGAEIAELVRSVSEQDKSLPWKERKLRYLAHLKDAPLGAIAICLADKIDNMMSLRHSVTEHGVGFLKVFNAPPAEIFWYHQECMFEASRAVGTPSPEDAARFQPLFERYVSELEALRIIVANCPV